MDFLGIFQNNQSQTQQQQIQQTQQTQQTQQSEQQIQPQVSQNQQIIQRTNNQQIQRFNNNYNKNRNNGKQTRQNGFTQINLNLNQQNQKQNQQQVENKGFFSTMTNTLGITTSPNQQNRRNNLSLQQMNQEQQINQINENAVVLSNKNMENLTINNKNKNKNKNKKEEERGFFNTITNVVGITEKPKEKNTISIYKSINTTKKHYFIGYMVNNEKQVQDLIQIQNKLITKYKMRKFYKNWDQKFVSRFVYMGYLTPEVAQKYMEKIMKDLCKQITNKFNSLVCKYNKIKPKFDKSINWISLSYDDQYQYLSKVIIPFLDKYGIKPIFPNRKTLNYPMIDIIHFKQSSLSKQDVIDLPIPNDSFVIDHLCLLSGKPTQTKIGGQSIHDRLAYEEEGKYYFPFKI